MNAKNNLSFNFELVQRFSRKINELLETKRRLEYTGPTLRKKENNNTISFNIYPTIANFENDWNILQDQIDEFFGEVAKFGEIIKYKNAVGEIIDSGTKAFGIKKANLYECYFYEPESFLYLRLLHEYDFIKEKEWISIDIDSIDNSSWFEELTQIIK